MFKEFLVMSWEHPSNPIVTNFEEFKEKFETFLMVAGYRTEILPTTGRYKGLIEQGAIVNLTNFDTIAFISTVETARFVGKMMNQTSLLVRYQDKNGVISIADGGLLSTGNKYEVIPAEITNPDKDYTQYADTKFHLELS